MWDHYKQTSVRIDWTDEFNTSIRLKLVGERCRVQPRAVGSVGRWGLYLWQWLVLRALQSCSLYSKPPLVRRALTDLLLVVLLLVLQQFDVCNKDGFVLSSSSTEFNNLNKLRFNNYTGQYCISVSAFHFCLIKW